MCKRIIGLVLVGLLTLSTTGCNSNKSASTEQVLAARLQRVVQLEKLNYTDEYKEMVADIGWVFVQMHQDYPEYNDIDLTKYASSLSDTLYETLTTQMEQEHGINYYVEDGKELTDVYTNDENKEVVDMDYLLSDEYVKMQQQQEGSYAPESNNVASFDLEAFNQLSEEEQTERINNMNVDELYSYLKALGGDDYNAQIDSMSEEEKEIFFNGEKEQEKVMTDADVGYYLDDEKDTSDTLVEKTLEEVMEQAEETEANEALTLVYQAFYENRTVLRYKNNLGTSITLHVNGNPSVGILSINAIQR